MVQKEEKMRSQHQHELSCMFEKEQTYFNDSLDLNVIYGSCSENKSSRMNIEWRTKMSKWAFEVINHFGYDHEILFIFFNYIDRFMFQCNSVGEIGDNKDRESSFQCNDEKDARESIENNHNMTAKSFKLVCMGALYLAIKLHAESNTKNLKLSSHDFSLVSNGGFSKADVELMENKMCHTLQWLLHPPTPMRFVTGYLQVALEDAKSRVSELTKQVDDCTEISKLLFKLSSQILKLCFKEKHRLYGRTKPSVLALSSVLYAMDILDEYIVSTVTLQIFRQVLDDLCLQAGLDSDTHVLRIELSDFSHQQPAFMKHVTVHLHKVLCSEQNLRDDVDRIGSPVCVSQRRYFI